MTPELVDDLIQRGQTAEREGRREEARSLFEQALRGLRAPSQAAQAAALMRWVGRTHLADGDLDAALDCLLAALAVAEAIGDSAAAGHAINLQASVYQQQGQLDRAESLYSWARECGLASGDMRLAAMTASNLGIIANIRGDLDRTLRFYETSLSEFRGLGALKEVCAGLNNMGLLHTDLQQWDAAIEDFDEALQIATAIGDIGARVTIEVNRAELHIAREEYPAARELCQSALKLSDEIGSTTSLGEIHKFLGIIARESDDLVQADQHFETAEHFARTRSDVLLAAETARERGDLHRRQGRNREALQQLSRSHRLFTELQAKRDLADVDRRTGKLERYFLDVVKSWSESIESKDEHTRGHCARVADIGCALAARVGLPPRELFWFRIGAMLHDVGKLIIPPEVLNKTGKLTDEEWALMKRHPVAGVEMLADIDFPDDIVAMVRSHHERWDGAGYPDQLAGADIPRVARILCVADVYDALTTRRSYKPALSHERAMIIMREEMGRHFDPELLGAFEELMRSRQGAALARTVNDDRAASGADFMQARPGSTTATMSGPVDDLTGVALRRPFVDAANRLLSDRPAHALITLLVIDVDEFKRVNDTHGHLQGDIVLRTVASTLTQIVGTRGSVARYAGDEFVVLLTDMSPTEARDLAVRVGTAMRGTEIPIRDRQGRVFVTLSIGLATATPEQREFEDLFAAADRALYEAKRRGRDTVAASDEVASQGRDPNLNIRQFVGRRDETIKLVRLLERTLEGDPTLIGVLGEAGVGKSTLVRQLVPEVRLRAGSLVAGRCLESDVKRPYAPWVEALTGIHQLGVVGAHDWRELPRILPELGRASDSTSGSKYTLFDEITSYVRRAADARPLVIVLDDMQWADSASWDVLEHLMAHLDRQRVLICLTIRAEDMERLSVERRHRLARDERYHEINLPRLSAAELEVWLSNVFEHQKVDEELLPLLHRNSEGNPLLVTQMLRMLLEDDLVQFSNNCWNLKVKGDLQLPAAVASLMERRLERLSRGSRRILSTAAVIGRVFDVDLAVEAGAGSEDEVLDAVEEAASLAVIEPWGSPSSATYTFTHTLLVSAVRRSVPGLRLARIHERVARALEGRTPQSPAEIAVHYDFAGNRAGAYRHALEAGTSAMMVYAHDEARKFFAMAERSAAGPADRAVALMRLAEIAETEGKYAQAEGFCADAISPLGDRVASAQHLPLRRMRERLRTLLGQPAQQTVQACQALLLEAVAHGDRAEEAALLGMISQAHSRLGDSPSSESVARDAVEAARATSDVRLHADALTRLGNTLIDENPDEAVQCYNRALSLFESVEDRCGVARCCINVGILHSRSGNAVSAEQSYDRGLTEARSAHASDLGGLAALNLGVLSLKRGRTELARERFDEALGLFTTTNHQSHRLATLYNLAHLARENGHWENALTLYTEAIEVAERIGQLDVSIGARAGHGLAALAVGRVAAAQADAWTLSARAEARPEWWYQGRELVDALRIRLAVVRGDDEFAARVFRTAVSVATRHDTYAAAWLVAECAGALVAIEPTVRAMITELAPDVESHGFSRIAARFATLRVLLNSAVSA